MSSQQWALELWGEAEPHPLAEVADEVLARFADGAARPQEVARLAGFADALASGESPAALEPQLRALSHAGFLRGAMVTMAAALRRSPRPEVAVMLARELMDAIDPELGVRLLHGVLAMPGDDQGRTLRDRMHSSRDAGSVQAMARHQQSHP